MFEEFLGVKIPILFTWLLASSRGSKKSFSNKLRLLYSRGVIDDDLYEDIKIVNNIRNLYAHKLFLEDDEKKIEEDINRIKIVKMNPEVKMMEKLSYISINLMHALSRVYYKIEK